MCCHWSQMNGRAHDKGLGFGKGKRASSGLLLHCGHSYDTHVRLPVSDMQTRMCWASGWSLGLSPTARSPVRGSRPGVVRTQCNNTPGGQEGGMTSSEGSRVSLTCSLVCTHGASHSVTESSWEKAG